MTMRYLVAAGMLMLAGCGDAMYAEESGRDQRKNREAMEGNAADAVAGGAMNDLERMANADTPPSQDVAASGVDAPAAAQAGCQSPGALLGKWKSADGNITYEFAADGQLTLIGKALGTMKSKYCVIAPGKARIEGETGTRIMEYTMAPDGKSFTGVNAFGQPVVNTRVGG